MKEYSFDQLPEAVNRIETKLIEIEQLLNQLAKRSSPVTDDLMTVQEAAAFLHLSVATIYGQISKRELPVMKRSGRCYFSRHELTEYIKAGRRKTLLEIEAEATDYLLKKKGLKR